MIQNYNNKYGSNFTILYRYYSQSFHMQMSCPVLHNNDFGAIQALIQHLLIVDSIITLYGKNNIKYYSSLRSQDSFTFI